ncbi:hypothetical protein LZ31DRAFT_347631 [Colletotrichum somersetense]|nr:hypothetical protein LZ31DRAFT_347631 [Colletotrichum somersetense]
MCDMRAAHADTRMRGRALPFVIRTAPLRICQGPRPLSAFNLSCWSLQEPGAVRGRTHCYRASAMLGTGFLLPQIALPSIPSGSHGARPLLDHPINDRLTVFSCLSHHAILLPAELSALWDRRLWRRVTITFLRDTFSNPEGAFFSRHHLRSGLQHTDADCCLLYHFAGYTEGHWQGDARRRVGPAGQALPPGPWKGLWQHIYLFL